MSRPGAPSRLIPFLVVLGLAWGGALLVDHRKPPVQPAPGGAADPDPLVLVKLERFSSAQDVELRIRGRFVLLDDQGAVRHEAAGFRGWLRLDPAGLKLGPWRLDDDRLWLQPDGAEAIELGANRYDGRLRLEVVREKGLPVRFDTFLELPLEDYVLGVVCGELPTQARGIREALRAQAVAARGYAVWSLREGRRYLRDSPSDQHFRSLDWITDEAREAVASTRGQVLFWEGRVLPSWYHASCGGRTSDAREMGFGDRALPPLAGVADPACAAAREWKVQVPAATLDRIAVRDGLGGSLERMVPRRGMDGDRVLHAVLIGRNANLEYRAEDLRRDLRVPSTQWRALQAVPNGDLVIQGVGNGHGVGLCQEGAMRLAREGADLAGILAHYYPGAVLGGLGPRGTTES